jgi:hypothetical protein
MRVFVGTMTGNDEGENYDGITCPVRTVCIDVSVDFSFGRDDKR